MANETLIFVVGGDYLAFEICREILKTEGHRVILIWKREGDERATRLLTNEVQALDAEFGDAFCYRNDDPTDPAALRAAGLEPRAGVTYCIVAVANDDRLNLRVALLARDINDRVRVTLRQFNPVLGHKIQEGLKYNCTAISPAAHAAATFAAAAVDPSCFYALPFPTLESVVARMAHRRTNVGRDERSISKESSLFAFSERAASDYGVAGMTVSEAERKLSVRIVSVNGHLPYACRGEEDACDADLVARRLEPLDELSVFGPVDSLKASYVRGRALTRSPWVDRMRGAFSDLRVAVGRSEPTLRAVYGVAALLSVLFVIFFTFTLHLHPLAATYYVITTMATVGYGDISPCTNCMHDQNLGALQMSSLVVAMFMMLVGITIVAVFTATLTATLNAATTRRLRGLRPIHRSDHIIVCGAGNVGSLVIDYLRDLGERVVVVEKNPDALLVELARDQQIDLLTGDATNDETIGYCSPERAKSLVGVTNSDTANLEVALGARTRTRERSGSQLPIVLRIDDLAFGASIDRHFGIASFSTTELTAPTIAGLARFESTRGRFDLFSGTPLARSFQLAERFQEQDNVPPPAPPERPGYKVRFVPLYVWREGADGKGRAIAVHKFAGDVLPGDRLLFMVPLDQFVDESEE